MENSELTRKLQFFLPKNDQKKFKPCISTIQFRSSNAAVKTFAKVIFTIMIFISGYADTFGQVDGKSVVYVNYGSGEIFKLDGSVKNWREVTNTRAIHNFEETARDEWSVYLLDKSRDISLQLDLYKKEIYIYWERPNRRKLYNITNSRAAVSQSAPIQAPAPPTYNASPTGLAGYKQVAAENETLTTWSPVDVAYGANGSFIYKSGLSGKITFSNEVFGDPAPGITKHGYIKINTQTDLPKPEVVLYRDGIGSAAMRSTTDVPWVGDSWNDVISCIEVPSGYKVIAFWDSNYGGKSIEITGTWCASQNPVWNDQISSFKIIRIR